MKLPRMLLVAGLATLLAPAAANADSILYIDQGNVWSASPDGARKVQLTTGGGWHSPTQADDGTIAAVQGAGPIQVMGRDGRPLRTITTPMAPSSNGGVFEARPQDLSFSPDGTKIAYSYSTFSCPPGSSCGAQRSTFYTHADVTEATPIATYGNQFGASNPEWVTNSRTLVFGGYGRQVSIDDLGPGDYSQVPWMVPDGDMGDGEVTRDGKRLAVTSDYGENTRLSFFAVTGDIKSETPAYPEWACSMTNPDPNFADPSWAPDGFGIAWQSSKGVEVSRFTKFGPAECEAPNDVLISATGSEPDWGPADPPAAAYTPPPAPAPAPTEPTPTTPATATIKLPKTTAKALRKGLAVKVTVPSAGKAKLVATVGRRKVASGSKTAKAAGTVTVKLSKVRTSLRGKTLTLKLTFNNTTSSTSLRVR